MLLFITQIAFVLLLAYLLKAQNDDIFEILLDLHQMSTHLERLQTQVDNTQDIVKGLSLEVQDNRLEIEELYKQLEVVNTPVTPTPEPDNRIIRTVKRIIK